MNLTERLALQMCTITRLAKRQSKDGIDFQLSDARGNSKLSTEKGAPHMECFSKGVSKIGFPPTKSLC